MVLVVSDQFDVDLLRRVIPSLVHFDSGSVDRLFDRLERGGPAVVLLDSSFGLAREVAHACVRGYHSLVALHDAKDSLKANCLRELGAVVLPKKLTPEHLDLLDLLQKSHPRTESKWLRDSMCQPTLQASLLHASEGWDGLLKDVTCLLGASKADLLLGNGSKLVWSASHRAPARSGSWDLGEPLCSWLRTAVLPVFAANLDAIELPTARAACEQLFNFTRASVLVPLMATGIMQGCLLLGRRLTGAWSAQDGLLLLEIGDELGKKALGESQLKEKVRWDEIGKKLASMLATRLLLVNEWGEIIWHNAPSSSMIGSCRECRLVSMDLAMAVQAARSNGKVQRLTMTIGPSQCLVDVDPTFIADLVLVRCDDPRDVDQHVVLNSLTSIRACVELLQGNEDLKAAAHRDIETLQTWGFRANSRGSLSVAA